MINLGDKCREQVTGFEGIATSRVEYMNGCVRYCLEAPGKDGGVEELYFDEQRLSVIQADAVIGGHDGVPELERPGGSRQSPPRTGAR